MNVFWMVISLIVGAALGAFHFGGLWITVQRLRVTRQPALLMLTSFIVRMGIVLLGFYIVVVGGLPRLIVCVAGFLFARTVLVRRLGDLHQVSSQPAQV